MSKKTKELKQQKKEVVLATVQAKIKANMLKIRECLKCGDTVGAEHYSSLNKQLRGLIK